MCSKNILISTVLILIGTSCVVESARILGIFHFPSKSHHILGSALLKALAKKGHQVTMISPFPEKEPIPNYTDVELDGLIEMKDEQMALFANTSALEKFLHSFQFIPKILKSTIQHPNIAKLMKSEAKFDVIIQFWAFGEMFLGLADHFKAPVIAFSPIGGNVFINYHSGNSAPYSYVPNMFLSLSDKMSFFERVINTLSNIACDLMYTFVLLPFHNSLYKETFPNGAPLEELIEKVDLYLINSHASTETHRPYLPNMITIGGFHIQEEQKMPKELQEYLDSAKEGVIYVSFGSNVNSAMLKNNQKEALVKSLEKQKMKVLWKFDEELPTKSKNIKFSKWLPQKSILGHPNVKLFVSHGGMGGISEAIYGGVPFVGIPFFGDQDANVADAVQKGYAVKVDKDTFTEEALSAAIQEVLTNSSYREKIQLRSSIYKNQEIDPEEKAIYWVEHVIKHKGAKHLKAASSRMPFYQYYLLDVIAFLSAIVLTGSAITFFVTRKICRFLCSRFCKEKQKKGDKQKTH